MKKLPIGQQSFSNLRNEGFLYIDKTEYLHKLVTSDSWYTFISRPRRFGKSLLISALQALFEGKKELFEGLYIYDKHNWQAHPVVKLDMSALSTGTTEGVAASLAFALNNTATEYGVKLLTTSPIDQLNELIGALFQSTGQKVVVLVDEYDKPILDNITDLEKAQQMRELLRNFYTVLKSVSAHLRFVLLTGVSKLSQTSLFSGLNNLNDISLDRKYAAICGYTQSELEENFAEYISQLAAYYGATVPEMLQKIKDWYNGYSWDGRSFVYNPFSVLLLMEKEVFAPHWFATGSPSFLIKLLQEKQDYSPLLNKSIVVGEGFSDKQSLEQLSIVPLCFQTGYLTVKERDVMAGTYTLGIPNNEVRQAFTEDVLSSFTGKAGIELTSLALQMRDAFATGNTADAIAILRILFSQISYNTHQPSESHYHALFQLTMNLSGVKQRAEAYSALGRTDSVLEFPDKVYVVEIKYAATEAGLENALNVAIKQIATRRYHEPFLNQGLHIHLLGLAFTKGGMAYREEII
jgi:hypothetical protein